MQNAKVKCPYCGNIASYIIKEGFNTFWCEIDDAPGCDWLITVHLHFEPVIEVFKMIKVDKDAGKEISKLEI